MNRLIGVLLILLIIAIGSAASLGYIVATSKPQTITESTTESYYTISTETVPTTETVAISNKSTYPVITLTVQTVLVVLLIPTCTTVSGNAIVVYSEAVGAETTTVTTIFPPQYAYGGLPSNFLVTVTTNSTVIGSDHTQPFTGSCG